MGGLRTTVPTEDVVVVPVEFCSVDYVPVSNTRIVQPFGKYSTM